MQSFCLIPDPKRLPAAAGERRKWSRLYGSARALALTEAALHAQRPLVVLCSSTAQRATLEQELHFYGDGLDLPLLVFPDWETLPYDHFSPYQDIVSERLATLQRSETLRRGFILVTVASAMQKLAPKSYLHAYSFDFKTGDRLDPRELSRRLEQAGYMCVPNVMEHGEFAVRGGIVDLFPMGASQPFRIDLFDEEIESIRLFDPESQRSQEAAAQIRLLPGREFPLDENAVKGFRQRYRALFEGDPQRSQIYRSVSEGNLPPGIEYYLPLFFEETATLFDYLPANAILVADDDLPHAVQSFWHDVEERFAQFKNDKERPPMAPAFLFMRPEEWFQAGDAYPGIELLQFKADASAQHTEFDTLPPPSLTIDARTAEPLALLKRFLRDFPGSVLFAAESLGRQETLLGLLRDHGIDIVKTAGWQAFLSDRPRVAVTLSAMDSGLQLSSPALAVIAESQLFGQQVRQQRRRRRGRDREPENIIKNLAELKIGDPVVHIDYGVGRYRGLEILDVGEYEAEFLTLEYADGDKLYVPVSSLQLISRYTGASPDTAPLHRLGSDQWKKARRKATEKVKDVAVELLDLYAKRAARQGFAVPIAEEQYAAFAADFPFEETPDQQEAIEKVLQDLESNKPMDRVICGDVGFGKTEVAMRAAFAVAMSGKQVAILVPTTLLAQQHAQNFNDRFASWPVKIEVLSRFRSKKQQDEVLAKLKDGTVDVVIGTHKLISNNIQFKRLGLVIIDEEHRFGVRQKEKLKSLRAQVDVLTLTATPIPRTLNMAMSGLRDLSIIGTPPARRLAIKTFVREWSDALIQEACDREIKRGGQVFFLHNEVETIDTMLATLSKILPEARIQIAHGQMRERDLEHTMLDFYHHRFNILLCTTIIETGIDIPNANTIIINRADRFGLAQLHQLRGRVGRSHRRAYAFLVVPPKNNMTADAIKRLEAIESLEELGVGFTLATHDLEIRGAGELLGEEQSGQIHEIGYALYCELLERAVAALKSGKQPELDQPLHHGAEIDLQIPALIPEDYLPDVHTRLIMYKRISSAADNEALRELQVEMIDRFGLLPDAVKSLFRLAELKRIADPLGIEKIELGPKGGRILFGSKPNIDPIIIIRLLQTQSHKFKMGGEHSLRITMEIADAESRFQAIQHLLDIFGKNSSVGS